MPSWGNNDNAANAPVWAASTVNLRQNRTNVTSLFDNATANSFAVTLGDGSVRQNQVTYGLYGVDPNETQVADAFTTATGGYIVHAGWNLVKTGSGGRAGRVQTECLVALANVYGDSDGQFYANVAITLAGPGNLSVLSNTLYANVGTFGVTPTLTGNTAANLTYQWQYNTATGSLGWTNAVNNANIHFTGATTNALSVYPHDTANNTNVFRVTVTAADEGVSVTSANVTLSVPA